jgi:apolipoprotein N-acyltransferase
MGNFSRGISSQPLPTPKALFGILICYEAIFPDLARNEVKEGADILINITNDAWFGRSSASYQHFAMVTFRAIENRVAVARAANTGISGFIDPYGRILSQSEIFVDKTLTQDIPLRTITTFYSRYGDLFARLCMLLSIVGIAAHVYRRKKNA